MAMVEFDCADCGAHVLGYGGGPVDRCAVCAWLRAYVPEPELQAALRARWARLEADPLGELLDTDQPLGPEQAIFCPRCPPREGLRPFLLRVGDGLGCTVCGYVHAMPAAADVPAMTET